MLKFTISSGRVIVDPTLLMIEEFTNILDYAKDKSNEELGQKMLLYVFFCCDLTNNNPLRDVDYRLKETQAFARSIAKVKKKITKKEEGLLDEAIDAYNFFNENALERTSLTYDKKIDEIRSKLDDLEPEVHAVTELHLCDACKATAAEDPDHQINDVLEITKFVSNDSIIANFSKQLNDMAAYKLRAMETAKKIENVGRVRGDKGSSLIERGAFRKEDKK